MKIVINALSARLGGGQTYLKNLLTHLPEQPELEILVYAPPSLRLPDDRRIHRATTNWPTENPVLRSLWERFGLPRILFREKVDVLFCPGGVVLSRVPNGCKVVTMFRNMIPFDPEALARIPIGLQKVRNFILKRVMLRSMANADLTIFISDHARRVIQALTRVPNPVTIPHGISAAFRTHAQTLQRPGWLPTGDYLLYVSRFDIYKHQLEVASAFAALPSDLARRYKLLLIGELDDALVRRVTELARTKGLESQIVVVGPIAYADLPAAYHHATVNLFASSCENCPNILLEALGAGRPVLSSDVMPMPEFGVDAVDYFTPTDPTSICDALARVLQNETRRIELAAAAARRSADFDWANTSRTTWRHITGLVTK
ncbi:MAG TPA: glycosyltransferase family 1 protein [Polaromonas sp.]|uniref:glycosyltransferase family 4 protein n=1 Tax=Polaromonas sp. UBA4122 TaxID=1947074 RepID=UPI000ED3C362|nr:glycosyltransferase family 1 protein [Polaromonas sp. UBA4122]HAL39238.1 glycosyltransferase family 1 protein [Polaromonas sp.]